MPMKEFLQGLWAFYEQRDEIYMMVIKYENDADK